MADPNQRARRLAQHYSDDPVTWGQLLAFQARTVRIIRATVKDEVVKVDFNGALGRLRDILPELERVAKGVRDEDGFDAVAARRAADRKQRWGWLAEPGKVIRGAIIAGAGAVAGVVVSKLL